MPRMLTRTAPGTAPGIGADDRAGVSARSMVLGLAIGVPVSIVLLYVATRGVAWEDVRSALREAHAAPLAAAVATMAGVYLLQGLRWRWIARRQARSSRRAFVGMVVAGIGANNVLPGRVGDLLRAHWLALRTGTPRSRTLATVVVDRACDVFVLLAFLIATFPCVPRRTWIDRVFVVSIVVTAVIAAGLVATRLYVAHRARDGRTLPLSVRLSWPGRQLSGLIRGTAAVAGPADLAAAVALSVAAWLLWAAGAWLVADALGIDLALWQAAFMTGLVNLGTAVPSSPGFVGTYQWLCVSGLGLFDVGASQAFAFSLLLQAVWFVPTTLVGVPLAVRFSMERRRA